MQILSMVALSRCYMKFLLGAVSWQSSYRGILLDALMVLHESPLWVLPRDASLGSPM